MIAGLKRSRDLAKWLHLWVRSCVLNYQAGRFQKAKLIEKAFFGWRWWCVRLNRSREAEDQALQYDQYRIVKRVFGAWRKRSEFKAIEKERMYLHQSSFLVNWMR